MDLLRPSMSARCDRRWRKIRFNAETNLLVNENDRPSRTIRIKGLTVLFCYLHLQLSSHPRTQSALFADTAQSIEVFFALSGYSYTKRFNSISAATQEDPEAGETLRGPSVSSGRRGCGFRLGPGFGYLSEPYKWNSKQLLRDKINIVLMEKHEQGLRLKESRVRDIQTRSEEFLLSQVKVQTFSS